MPAPSPVFASQPQAPRCSRLIEDLDRLADDVVRLAVLQIDDEADAAGIVLVPRVVQALCGRGQACVSSWLAFLVRAVGQGDSVQTQSAVSVASGPAVAVVPAAGR